MMNFQNGSSQATTQNYAAQKNARFSLTSSQIRSIKQRWDDTYNSLPDYQQRGIDYALTAAIAEFKRRNPHITNTATLKSQLARAYNVAMSKVAIDETMQRQLNIDWVIHLLNQFVATKVIPIQVYQPDPAQELFLAWDGQHTLVLLWLITTQIFGEDPENFEIPVNIYASHLKAEMRGSFIDLNSDEGKKMLDLFDKMEQMIYAVRVDGSQHPLWQWMEQKQKIVENHGLFLTSKKFGDDIEPGAISRMQEVYKSHLNVLEWVCTYFTAVGGQKRPIEEKEMVMMYFFFERCRLAKLDLTIQQVHDIANVAKTYWKADFSPTSTFWVKAGNAYKNWHDHNVGNGQPRFKKEPLHGYPFLAETMKKYVTGLSVLDSSSSSEFKPFKTDLY